MTPSRYRQIERLYHAARERAASDRASFLDESCAGDEELRQEVESLLAQDAADADDLEDASVPVFAAGSEIGSYRIEGQIGQGGMGVVYKALDTRLNRPVAVKLLSNRLADAAARRRFQREARTASSLNHPHILTVYEAGDHEGQQYLVTEYIDGGTLREWNQGGRTWQDIAELLTGVADGLAAAHDAKILHRDIKPANILVMKSGYAKLADFGLAKLASAAPGPTDPTKTATLQTRPGTVMGTVAYMAPEQAQGRATDARSDIFSFGVVLYELLEGRRPFDGRSELETLHKVIEGAPEPLGEHVPAALRAVVGKALQKDPAERYQNAREMVADLGMLTRGSSVPALSAAQAPARAQSFVRRHPALLFTGAAALLLTAAAGWYFGGRGGPIVIPSEFVPITNFSDYATAPALSRDGTMLAFFRGSSSFAGTGQVYVKLLSSGESKQLTDDAEHKYGPVFTPDGSRVAYTVQTHATFETWTVPVFGGTPSRLMPNAAGLSWLSPDHILFSEVMPGTAIHMGIVTARENRAEERKIYFPAHERAMAHYSYPSPHQDFILVVEMNGVPAWQPCRLVPIDGKSSVQVGPPGACTAAGWSPDGKWMYFIAAVNGAAHLWRQRFAGGSPEQITFGPTEEEGLAVAPDGKSLITAIGLQQSSLWLKDNSGEHRLPVEGSASQPAFSSDGKRLYYLLQKVNSAGSYDLWARDLATGISDPVLTGQKIVDYDISPDQKNIAFTVGAAGGMSIFMASMDHGSAPRLIAQDADGVNFAGATDLVFRQLGDKASHLALIHTDGTGQKRILEATTNGKPTTSPDGQWAVLAGVHDPSQPAGTYAVSLRDGSRRVLCQGPCVAKWSPDSKFLFLALSRAASDENPALNSGQTLVIPLARGLLDAPIPATGFPQASDHGFNGLRVIRQGQVSPGIDGDMYAYAGKEFQGNLFRIPLHSR